MILSENGLLRPHPEVPAEVLAKAGLEGWPSTPLSLRAMVRGSLRSHLTMRFRASHLSGSCAAGRRFGAHLAVEDLADFSRQRVGGEGFGQQVDVGIEPAVMDDRVAGIAGDEQHL